MVFLKRIEATGNFVFCSEDRNTSVSGDIFSLQGSTVLTEFERNWNIATIT